MQNEKLDLPAFGGLIGPLFFFFGGAMPHQNRTGQARKNISMLF